MKSFDRDQIRKILVVRNDNIGDVVCTTPCFEALRLAFPHAMIAVLVCRLTEDVVVGNPYLNQVYVYDKAKHGMYRSPFTAWWKQLQVLWKIRKEGFDLALGIRSEFSPSLGWLVFASGAPFRVGIRPTGKNKRFSMYYNIYVDPVQERIHEVERSLHVLRRVGVDIPHKRLHMAILSENVREVDTFFSKQAIPADAPLICIGFSRRMEEGRYWDHDNYLRLMDRLASEGLSVIATCSPPETSIVDAVLRRANRPIPLFSSPHLKSFAEVIRRSAVFVTVEGGPMHIAAAVGTKVVALFGKTPIDMWYPYGNGHIVLHKGNRENLIPVDDVFQAVQRLCQGRRRHQTPDTSFSVSTV